MSLSVWPYTRHEKLEWLSVESPNNDLAGTESSRTSFWGSSALKRMGLRILPSLETGDIYAEGNDLLVLEQELSILEMQLPSLVSERNLGYWQFRLSNIRQALHVALESGGGVFIG